MGDWKSMIVETRVYRRDQLRWVAEHFLDDGSYTEIGRFAYLSHAKRASLAYAGAGRYPRYRWMNTGPSQFTILGAYRTVRVRPVTPPGVTWRPGARPDPFEGDSSWLAEGQTQAGQFKPIGEFDYSSEARRAIRQYLGLKKLPRLTVWENTGPDEYTLSTTNPPVRIRRCWR